MKFVYPEFLFAFLALAIPVIVHLFNFRKYKRVYFSNVAFLKDVKEQTQSRSRLKHLLVLASRILALTFLIFAFAQPFIPGSDADVAKGEKIISVYIDNSFSMDAEGKNGRLLEVAKQKAKGIAEEYAATDRFQLVTNDFEGYEQRLVSREEFMELVDQVKLSPATRSFNEVLLRQMDVLQNESEKTRRLVWLSDFQKSTAGLEALEGKETPKVIGIPLQAEVRSNLFVDSVWFVSPTRQLNAQEKLMVRIRNSGETRVENAELRLSINGAQKSITTFTVEPGTSCDSALVFTNTSVGVQSAEVSIGDVQIGFDDTWYFSYRVENHVDVLSIVADDPRDTNGVISRLFYRDPFYRLNSKTASRVDYATLAAHQLIVVNELPNLSSGMSEELRKYIESGGNVLLIPSLKADLNTYNALLSSCGASGMLSSDTSSTKPEQINGNEPFFAGVFEKDPAFIDLPQIRFHYRMESSSRAPKEALWRLRDGSDFLNKYVVGKGNLYFLTSSLHEKAGNFGRHALVVPVLLRIAEWSQNSGISMQTIGNDLPIDVRVQNLGEDQSFEISNAKAEQAIVPEVRNNGGSYSLYAHGQIRESGNYFVKLGEESIAGVGYNYNRKESLMEFYSAEELTSAFRDAGLKEFSLLENAGKDDAPLSLEAIDNSSEYWKLCLILTLIFLLIEIVLIRWMKN
jgi:hypothetical protein